MCVYKTGRAIENKIPFMKVSLNLAINPLVYHSNHNSINSWFLMNLCIYILDYCSEFATKIPKTIRANVSEP